MLNNLTNFLNLITSKRVTTSASGNDLVVLGVNDLRTPGIYQPVAIKVSDLIGGGAGVTQIVAGSGISVSPIGGTGIVTVTNTGGLPSFLEYNITNKTVWNNGQGNIGTNTSFGEYALQSVTSATYSTAFGQSALQNLTTGNSNTAFGNTALNSNTTGQSNTAIGLQALLFNTTGGNNTAIGYYALRHNTTGNTSVAIGAFANGNTTATSVEGNVAIGFESGYSGGGYNVFIGYQAARQTGGSQSVVIGNNAMQNATASTSSVVIGSYAMGNGGNGVNNTIAIGYTALLNAMNTFPAANLNVAIGSESMRFLNNGQQNVGVGNNTLRNTTSATFATALGDNALYNNTTGTENTAVGAIAAYTNTTGSYNTLLGYFTATGNFSGSVILGHSAAATANNQFVVGSTTQNAGTVTTESLASTRTWSVKINGTDYKILLA